MADNPAQNVVNTIGQQVMQPAKNAMDYLQNLDQQAQLRVLLERLGLVSPPQPPQTQQLQQPPLGGGRDIALPPDQMRRQAVLGQMKGQ